MGALTPSFDQVGKVTIVPRSSGAGGFTLFVPSEEQQDSGLYSRKYLEAQLAVAPGGRVAEEIVYGDEETTTGASSDLQRVADVARRMVTQWGFASDKLGSTAWEGPQGSNFQSNKMASEATQQRIDAAVEQIVRDAHAECTRVLSENRALLDELTDLLVERETVGNDELMELVRKHGAKVPKGEVAHELAKPAALLGIARAATPPMSAQPPPPSSSSASGPALTGVALQGQAAASSLPALSVACATAARKTVTDGTDDLR
eukprot:CAMPEP_0206056446 /NCGR_PEP_ID=MMETSP1466-20131121/42231_1 /ASSEMBLY_ACC=CAM_ASM_001126 /TAXON_ID=44452 /ORGANISM="Pavlova gyrans, Strain CCMP608" /LENGTH=260 /DNA_ID=CAMNT_0053431681 /DNA_START=14 /DNA_END=796 /DNA_ORIENTATION=+